MSRARYFTETFTSCGMLVVSCLAASAADLPSGSRTIPADSWTGFYIGVGGGLSSLNNKVSAQPGPNPSSPVSASLNGLGASGLLATISAGYDYEAAPSWVFGMFGDFDVHGLKSTLDVDIPSAPLSVHGDFSLNRQWSLGGRIGYLTTPGTLVFLSAGVTELSASHFTVSASGGGQNVILGAPVSTITGGFVGTGFETKLTHSLSLKGEYRFTEFGSGRVALPTIDGTDLNQFVTARISPTLQIVKASVNYRF